MRQTLVTIESSELHEHNIPQLYFDENVILIVYDDFSNILYRYVHTPRIFILPRMLYQQVIASKYTITEQQIKFNNSIISNTDATLDGVPYFPKDEIQLDVQKEYLQNYRKYIPERIVEGNVKNLKDAIESLKKIKVPTLDYSNLEMRIQRLEDFGNKALANKLRSYFKRHKVDFVGASSLSIQFNDLDDISFEPLQSGPPALYVKLHKSTGVYSWTGYSTFIDTLTRVLFYKTVNNYVDLFAKYFSTYKPVFVVYGILNYHIAQGIHEKTNRNDKFYNMLLEELME
jgi:hypothetical protein